MCNKYIIPADNSDYGTIQTCPLKFTLRFQLVTTTGAPLQNIPYKYMTSGSAPKNLHLTSLRTDSMGLSTVTSRKNYENIDFYISWYNLVISKSKFIKRKFGNITISCTPVVSNNNAPHKVEKIICNCNFIWSLAHQFTYTRLSDLRSPREFKLVNLYAARARRIAATYARFYLETEVGGDRSKRGRYYWMALGAFASKTVSCILDKWQLEASYLVNIKTIANGLAKGNLWLFTDVAASHWFYNNYKEHFDNGMKCIHNRDTRKLEQAVKKITDDLPFAKESLHKAKYLRSSSHIIKAFKYVELIENASTPRERRVHQYDHLMAVADHEQGPILQKLIYDDPDFSFWTRHERGWYLKWISPAYQLSFSKACEVEESVLKSEAPSDMVVENFASRMSWIEDTAKQFHKLMITKSRYMTQELSDISSWKKSKDAKNVY